MKKWMSYVDIYGTVFNFTINKNQKYKTLFGGFLTLITFIICIIIVYLFGKDFFYKTNPTVLEQKIISAKYDKILINSKNLTIAWRIEDINGNPISFDGFFYPKINYLAYENNKTTDNFKLIKKINFKIIKCSEIIKRIEPNFIKNYKLDQWYCLDYGDSDLEFGGFWNTDFLFYISLTLDTCINDVYLNDNGKCVNKKKLDSFLNQEIYISFMFPNIGYMYSEYENPFEIVYQNFYRKLDSKLARNENCDFNRGILQDDKGIIFATKNDYVGLNFLNCDLNMNYKEDSAYDNQNISIHEINFYLNKSLIFNKRKFMKIQELAAITGGFVNLISLFFTILNFFLNIFERDKFFINYLYKYSKEDEDNLHNIQSRGKIINNINKNPKKISLKENENNSNVKNEDFKIKNKLEENELISSNKIEMNNYFSHRHLNEKSDRSSDNNIIQFLSLNTDTVNVKKSFDLNSSENKIDYNGNENEKYKKILKKIKIKFKEDIDNNNIIFRDQIELLNSKNEISINKENKKQNKFKTLKIQEKNKFTQDLDLFYPKEIPENEEKEKIGKLKKDFSKNDKNISMELAGINKNKQKTYNNSLNISSDDVSNFFFKSSTQKIIKNPLQKSMELDDPININQIENEKKNVLENNIKINNSKDYFRNFSYRSYICMKVCAKNKYNKKQNSLLDSFEIGRHALNSKLDLVKYLNNFQLVKIIAKVILNDNQRFYSKNYYKKCINPDNVIKHGKEKEIKIIKKNESMLSYYENLSNISLNNLSKFDKIIVNNILGH